MFIVGLGYFSRRQFQLYKQQEAREWVLSTGGRILGRKGPWITGAIVGNNTERPLKSIDYSRLPDLIQLRYLAIRDAQLEVLDHIQVSEKLTQLLIVGAPLTSLDSISRLKNLTYFGMRGNGAAAPKLDPLGDVTELNSVSLAYLEIDSLDGLSKLHSLRKLHLSYSTIRDFSGIEGAATLHTLSLRGCNIHDLSPIRKMTQLRRLSVAETDVVDLSPISKFHSLEMLDISRSKVSALGDLSSLKALQVLWMMDTPVTEIGVLDQLRSLHELNVFYVSPVTWEPVLRSKSLRRLYIGTNIEIDFRVIAAALPRLEEIQLLQTQRKARKIGREVRVSSLP